jgi:autotransporter-associated beta strand protein
VPRAPRQRWAASNPLVFAGGRVRATSTITSPATRDVTLSADAIVDANGQTTTFSGIVSGAGGLTLSTAGTLRLNGAATIGGDVTILAGTLRGSSTAGLPGSQGTSCGRLLRRAQTIGGRARRSHG